MDNQPKATPICECYSKKNNQRRRAGFDVVCDIHCQEAKATPRPWKISSCEHNDKSDIAQIIYGDIYGGGTIAELPKHKHLDCIGGKTAMYRNKGDKELAEANASLIVKAVNVHDLFLKASKQLMTEIKDKRYQGKPSDDTLDMFHNAIKQAQ